MKLKYFYRIIITFNIIISINACQPTDTNTNKQIFRYNESKNIATLDPAFARNLIIMWPVSQLFNGLVQMNDSLIAQPCIAKQWNISPDGKAYTFTLRNDVYFHDHELFPNGKGRKVTAYDFEYSFNRILDPKTASPGVWIFNLVDTKRAGSTNGFKAINDSTFEIYLKQPFPAFIGLLTMQYCSVIPHEIADYYGNDFRNHPVGTGPFQFKKWIEGEKLVFVKNEHYFEKDSNGHSLPYLDAINISFTSDKQSEFLELIKGRGDFISGVNPSYKDEMITRQGTQNSKYANRFNMFKSPYLNTEYLGILSDSSLDIVKKSSLRFKEVRQAINLGFDRKKMMSWLRNNIGYPATSGIVPLGLPGYDNRQVKGFEYNPDSARKLLAIAGFPGGKGLETIPLTTTSDYVDICEYIQQQLSQIGIKISIEVVTGVAFREMMAHSKLLFFRASWIADYPDPENYLSLFYSKNFSPNGPNYTHFHSTVFDQLYEQALNEPNAEKRNKIYSKMDQIIINQSAIVPLYYDMAIRFTSNKVKNLGINPLNQLNLKRVQVK